MDITLPNTSRLKPNDPYMGRTAPLTSKRYILYIYSTNIGTEYFKHALYSPFFLLKCSLFHNANLFDSCIINILYTECAKIKKKNNSDAKSLTVTGGFSGSSMNKRGIFWDEDLIVRLLRIGIYKSCSVFIVLLFES